MVEENVNIDQVVESDRRYHNAPWYKNKKDIIVGGCGGIGRGLIVELAKLNHNITVYDYDIVEEHNCKPQGFRRFYIGSSKVKALQSELKNFNCNISYSRDFYDPSDVEPVMISAFDNMKARKQMFEAWKSQENRELFIDGRMLAEQFQVFVVTPGREEEYEAHLFDDSEVENEPCTFKQTGFVASIIHGYITALFCNFLVNQEHDENIRNVPFFSEYISSLNYWRYEL